MSAEIISQYAWVFWLALVLIFVIIEVVTVDLTFLMLSLGSVGGLLAGVAGAPWWAQVILAAVLSLLLLFAVRPPLLRALKRGGDPAPSNVDALIGLAGTVQGTFSGAGGLVKLSNGETWTARAIDGVPSAASPFASAADTISPLVVEPVFDDAALLRPLQPGDRVVVTAIDGATAVVVLTEGTTP